MLNCDYLFTSESVSEGHPDKVCDRISDEIVDMIYREAQREHKKNGFPVDSVRVACETLATTNRVIIAGEVRVPPSLLQKDKDGAFILDDKDQPQIDPHKFRLTAKEAVKAIGYSRRGFDWKNLRIDVLLHKQSEDISLGVDKSTNQKGHEGAGDQGIMFGYACSETPDLMPAPIYYAHKILKRLAEARRNKENDAAFLGPDAKSQVTVRYKNGRPHEICSIVLSSQHLREEWDSAKVREVVEPYIREAAQGLPIAENCRWYINPTGKFVIGGPDGDAGLTGRKIIVDTYGGAAPHGGGAFSGKDPTKVDRSAAYIARYLAKNIVAADLAERCTIQLSYAIGIAEPLSLYVNLHNTGKHITEKQLEAVLPELVDLSPGGIREYLRLNKPIYAKTAAYGHFGREPEADGAFSWEKTDLVPNLKAALHIKPA